MSRIPHGIPTISYCRLQPSLSTIGQGSDLMSDGNAVIIHEPGQASARYEVAQVIDKTISDEEACELTFGHRAGVGVGAALNPVTAFVNDAANVVVLLTGSKSTRKWQFLKRTFLPFIANEIIHTISDRSQDLNIQMYKAQLTLSAFEIQDEIISDLLRPGNRGLSIGTTLEEGVVVPGLHRETVVDEATLRKLLIDACDNRAVQTLPVGGSIDTSSGIFEFRLYQSDAGNGASANPAINGAFQNRECYSRLIVVDLPSVDPLNVSNTDEIRLLAGPTLNKSLLTFVDVVRKLNNPYRAQLAPFRSAKLPHYLSELLGGNAIVVAMGQIAPGEPGISKRTMEVLAALNSAVHYPMGARELSDTLRGLLGKYRAMLMHMQDEMNNQVNFTDEHIQNEQQIQKTVEKLQNELAQALAEKATAIEDRSRIYEMAELLKAKYNTVMEEKLKQSTQLAEVEEDNIALAKTIVEMNLQIATLNEEHAKEKFDWNVEVLHKNSRIAVLEDEIKEHIAAMEKLTEEMNAKQQLLQGNMKEIQELQQQLEEKSMQLTEQKEKNIELGAELLTLVNRKDLMQQEYDKMKTEYDDMLQNSTSFQSKLKENEDEIRKLLEKLLNKDEEVLEMRKQLMDANDTCALAKIEAAASKRTSQDIQVLKEELEAKKMQQEEDRRRYASITEQLKDKMNQLEYNALRDLQQRNEELQRMFTEKDQLSQRLSQEIDDLKESMKSEQEERKKLLEELEMKMKEEDERHKAAEAAAAAAAETSKAEEKKGTEESESAKIEPTEPLEPKPNKSDAIRKAIASMKMSNEDKKEKERQRKEIEYQSQIRRLEEDLKMEMQQSQFLKDELQQLQEKYRNLLESSLLLSKSTPSSEALHPKKNSTNQEQEEIQQGKVSGSSFNGVDVDFALKTLLQSFEDNEKKLHMKFKRQCDLKNEVLKSYRTLCDHYKVSMCSMQDVLNVVQDPRLSNAEKSANASVPLKQLVDNIMEEQYAFSTNAVQTAENELNAFERNKRLDNDDESLHNDIESKERVAAIISTYQLQLRQAEQTLSEFQQKYITQQVQLKQLMKDQSMMKDEEGADSDNQQKQQYESLISEIKELRKQIFSNQPPAASRKPSAQLLQALRDAASGSVPPSPLDKGNNNPAKPPAQKDHNKEELRSQLVAAESRAAQATSRMVALEEELQSYQAYMRESIPNYQRQIQALQLEIKTLKKGKTTESAQKQIADRNKDTADGKLPPI